MPASSPVSATMVAVSTAMETVTATTEVVTATTEVVTTTTEVVTTTMKAVFTAMEIVPTPESMTAVKVRNEEVYVRSNITVWVRTVVRIIIPVIICRKGYAACQHKDQRYKKKFFHRAPPSRPFCFESFNLL